MKKKMLKVRDFIVMNSKAVFPILLIFIVAVTVFVALNAKRRGELNGESQEEVQASITDTDLSEAIEVPDTPLELNAYPAVNTLIYTYYDALANGNADAIAAISNEMEDLKKIKIQELAKYIEYYPTVEIYTKPGPIENSYVVIAYTKAKFYNFEEEVTGYQTFYVCPNEDGELYLNEGAIPQEQYDYIYEINFQDDVVELYNKVTVEYNDAMVANTDLFDYIATMQSEIRTATGLIVAAQETKVGTDNVGEGETDNLGTDNVSDENVTPEGNETTPAGPVYATTTATVNVRSSDSETADKLGKASSGSKIEVLEQKVNGWCKVKFEGKEGYIKTEYLRMVETAAGVETVGTVTATTTINIRAEANETAEKLGVLAGGESLGLVSTNNGWCKVVYNNQIAYVKADYVR